MGLLRKAVDSGYDVTLIYIAVEPVLSPLRIDQRVAAGGHDVPRNRIASRFERSLANLRAAVGFVPFVKIYDNSSLDEPFRLVAIFESGAATTGFCSTEDGAFLQRPWSGPAKRGIVSRASWLVRGLQRKIWSTL